MIIDKYSKAPARLTVEEEYPIFFITPRPAHVAKMMKEKEERERAKTTRKD